MPYQLTLPNGKVVGDIPDNIPQDKALGIIRGKMPDAFSAREEARKGTYELTLPNGKVVGDVPEGMPREQALEMIRARMPDAFSSPKEGMGAAFMGGLESLGSRLRTGVEAIVSPEEAARRGLERGEAISREYAPGASLQRVKDVYAERGLLPAAGEAISQIPTALAEQAPNMAATIASAKLGAMGGTAIAPGLGTVVGGVGGALAPSLMQLFGSNIERQAEVQRERGEPIDISRGKALAAAVPGAALEAASTFVPLGRTMVGKLLGPQGAKMLERGSTEATEALAKESLLKVAGKGAAIGAGVEIPTEVTQQMLERLQAGLPVTSEDALTEYGEAMYGAGLVGGPFGAAGRVGQRSLARQTLKPEAAPETAPEATPAPIPPSAYFDEPSPLENPYGNITAEAMPDVADEINAIRSKNKQSPLDSFSIEDAVNAGLPQERVDSILSSSLERAGISPELQIEPEAVYDAASVSGLDIEQPGFRDFLRRATGSESPEEMSPVQRVAALGAIQNIPEGVDSLPLGTNARSFTEAQYKAGLKAIKSAPAEGVTREEMVASIQQSGVKDMREAMSVLQTAIREGNVGGVSAPAYAVFDESGNAVGRYNDPQEASERAERLNGSVTEFAQTRYFPVEAGRAPAQQPAAAPREVAPDVAALRQKLAPALKRFGLEGVGLRVVKSIEDGGAGADGAYANKLIQVALSAENPMGVMRHEVIHALKELGAFTAKEWRVLEGKAKSEWVNKFIREAGTYERYQQVYENATGSLEGFDEYINEEAIAEAFKYFDATKVPPGLVGNLFGRIRNLFASLRNALQGAGFQTAEEVLGRIEEGKVTPTQAEAPAAAPKFSVARPTDEQFFEGERKQPKSRQVVFEIAPNPSDEDLSAIWKSLSHNQKIEISNKVKDKFSKSVMDVIGARGRVTDQVGSYLDETNASYAMYLEKGAPIDAARALGFVFKQKEMMVVSPNPAKGLEEFGSIVVDVGDKTYFQIQEIYNTLRGIEVNGNQPISGQTTSNGKMIILNRKEWSGMETEELAKYVDAALGNNYNVLTDKVYASFPAAKDYDYASPQNDPAGKAGDIRKRLRIIRDEASKALGEEIAAAREQAAGDGKFSLTPKRGVTKDPRYGKRVTTDTIEVDGQDRPTRTSKGTLIYPTEEGVKNFWRWFGNSVFVDEDGRPLVMYHGTAADIEEFIPKQANAIFITPQVEFSAEFKGGVLTGVATWSENWMVEHYDEILSPDQIEAAKLEALENIDPETKRDYKLSKKAHHSAFVETSEFMQAIKDQLPSRANVIPLFVKSENPFNYSNENHVRQAVDRLFLDFGVDLEQDPNGRIRFMNEADSMADREYSENEVYNMLTKGYWPLIEQAEVQDVIRDLGFDGFSVQESLVKNYAVFDPNQVKSSVGNDGNFSDKKGIRFSIAQSKTPEFKQWFRESKVSDKSGKPVLMYHSTPSAEDDIFSVFKRSDDGKLGQGIYTTSMEKYAEGFAPTGAVMPLWVSIQNPLYLDLSSPIEKGRSPRDVLRAKMAGKEDSGKVDYLRLDGSGAKEISDRLSAEIKAISGRRLMDMSGATIRRTLQKAGYDGIIVRDADGNFVEVNAFEPTQIKSATGNRGTFSPKSKDIRYSLTQTKTPEFKRWFGVSKVVDEDGNPLVVYHGTKKDFSSFKTKYGDGLFFFSTNSSFASNWPVGTGGLREGPEGTKDEVERIRALDASLRGTYMKDNYDFKTPEGEAAFAEDRAALRKALKEKTGYASSVDFENNAGIQVMPVYLSIQNPFDPRKDYKKIEPLLRSNGMQNLIDGDYHKSGNWVVYENKDVIDELKNLGYDGIWLAENVGGPHETIAAFTNTQIKSATGNRGTFDPANKDIRYSLQGGKAFELDPTTSKDNFVYLFADKNIDLKRVTEGVYKQGNKIADRWNAYEKEEAYYGRAAERIKQFATRDLHQLTKKMDGANISLQEMDDYLLARHAKEANAYLRTFNADPNQNAGMSDAEADAYMKAVPAAKKAILDRLAKDVDAITKGTRDLMVEYGLEDQKTVDQWAKTYKHYVPLFREETEESLPLSAGRGFSVRGSTSKRRTGSARKVVDVMANIALQREKVIARGEHNRVGNSLYGMVLLNPNPDFWSVIRPEKMTKDQLRTELFKLGIDPQSVDEMADRPVEKVIDKKTGMVTYNVPPFWKSNNNLLFTRINGKERIIAFNKNDERAMRLVTALKGMDAQKQAEVIKSMGTAGEYFNKAINFTGKTTRYFASINTQYNPAFGIYNLTRDVGGATINLQTTPLKGMERKVVSDAMVALKDIYKDLRRAREGLPPKSKWGRVFEDFGLQGGKSGFSELFKGSQDRSESLQNELKRFKEGKIKSKGRALMEWLSDFNEAIENAIRVSVYKNALDKGLSKQKAASLGKNITVNFNRTGAMSKHIQTLYAFFNAAIQGSARIAETLMTSDGKLSSFGKKFVTGGITLGMMQAVLLAMAGIDDDEIPEYIKDKSMVIPYGGGKYFSIPLPLGYHVIPAFGRRAMEFAMSDDKNVGKATISTAMMIADGFNPFGSATFLQTISPTALDPLVALAENKDFNSKPIAIEDVSSMSPTPGYERSSQNALAVTKAIAYGINILSGGTEFKPGDVSPTADQIEYLVGQITGGVGREALKIGRGTESIVTGEELATYNIPIIGRLVGNTQQQAAQRTRFYDNIKTMNEHQAEMEGRLNSDQDVTEYLKKYPEAALSQEADKIYRKISQLRSEKEELKALGEGRESIKRIDDLILELMTGFNELKTNYSKEIKANQ